MNHKSSAIDGDELQRRVRSLLGDVFRLGTEFFAAAASNTIALPKLLPTPRDSCNCGCCGIPETECPPRCCCRMHLAAMTGQTVAARIRVVNEAPVTRTFQLSATPFVSGKNTAGFSLSPSSLTILADGSALAIGTLVVPADFPKGRYQCEILVNGSYEQCVEVELEIGCDEILTGTCTVEQKEQRFRIRAHHWYDHFQCIEPCGHERIDHERGDQIEAGIRQI